MAPTTMKKGFQKRAELTAMRRERMAKRLAQQENIEDMLRSDESASEVDDIELAFTTKKDRKKKSSLFDNSEDDGENENDNEKLLEIIEHVPKHDSVLAKSKRGVIYLGHIPHGFYEAQMKRFFKQFGQVTRLRLSRNKKTGNSKHYAFIEFAEEAVAKIAAATMDGYLLYNQILVANVLPSEKAHAKLFEGANKTFRVLPRAKIHAEKMAKTKTKEQLMRTKKRLQVNISKRNKQLAKMGIKYSFTVNSSELIKKA